MAIDYNKGNITTDEIDRKRIATNVSKSMEEFYKTMPRDALSIQGKQYLKNRSEVRHINIWRKVLRCLMIAGIIGFIGGICYFYYYSGDTLYKAGKKSIDNHNNKIELEMKEADKGVQ